MDNNKKNTLFTEFPPVSTEQWEEVIKKDLKGADYERRLVRTTLDGIKARPYYRSENLQGLEHILDVQPGEFPYVRGDKSDNDWLIRQDIVVDDYEVANKTALDAIEKGTESLAFVICTNNPTGKDDVAKLLVNIPLAEIELNFSIGKASKDFVESLISYLGADATKVKGSIALDPLTCLTVTGSGCDDEACDYNSFPKEIFDTVSKSLPGFDVISIKAYNFKNSGSSIVQELAFGLSMANDYLAKATDVGIAIDDIASKIRFNFAVGPDYFMEIAKLRAARYLWAKLVEAYQPSSTASGVMKIHSVTAEYNQTIYDPYVNMLRSTTEAMSAVLGGTDSLTVLPFNIKFDKTNPFSERIARNQQILLKKESYFDKVADPSAGSYFIENLTDSIITEAWKLFLEVEDKGGYLEAFKQGFIQEQVKAIAQKRDLNIATRKEILLGTNQYPNFNEKVKDAVKIKASHTSCGCQADNKVAEPLKRYRGAEAFEEMRLKTENSGKTPKAFMFTYGNLTMRKARAQFSCNFFACAGFEVVDNNGFTTVQEGIDASKEANADIVVLCSADDEYPVISKEILEGLSDKIIVIAGYPKDSMEELQAMGIKHFVHVKSNVLETLKEFQSELGIN
jgi:methylmalonyl-CoA mutase